MKRTSKYIKNLFIFTGEKDRAQRNKSAQGLQAQQYSFTLANFQGQR